MDDIAKWGNPVSLEQMLAARDLRVQKQAELLHRYQRPLICFTLNLAGPYKYYPLAAKTFFYGKQLIEGQLRQNGVPMLYTDTEQADTGCCAYYVVEGDLLQLKALLCAIEETAPVGRLFDIDLLGPDGAKVSRTQIGLPERGCMICGAPSAGCARSRTHSVEHLQRHAILLMKNCFAHLYADHVATAALRALLYEVSATPKPGLVDRANSGAHQDMDFFTFLDSAAVLTPYFRKFVLVGCRQQSTPVPALFRCAQSLGLMAENAMFAATGGVNTHKGLIFSLGLLCLAAGRLLGQTILHDPHPDRAGVPAIPLDALLHNCQELAQCALAGLTPGENLPATHGQRAFLQYGARGVRAEAANGFPNAAGAAFSILQKGGGSEESGLRALLHLLSTVEDTNLLHRGGADGLKQVMETARRLSTSVHLREDLAAFDAQLTEKNLSPGGCADLLAIAYFLYFLCPEG